MASRKRVFDSPREWVREHVRLYVRTRGRKGHNWEGYPALLLTTVGRRSGKHRRTALIYGRDRKNFVVVASYGGRPHHPQWYLNLAQNPDVELQVGADKFSARAHTVSGAQREQLWKLMSSIFPPYDEYQVKAAEAGRQIPVVILEPVSQLDA